ncbi:MAG: hypothetical protein ACSHW7_14880 [Patiriisocius sp.]|uniref:hypothetical protein n=1 Tax=Patiriisocius sp. TaxID=2822396 RepID=UPI003EFA7AFD
MKTLKIVSILMVLFMVVFTSCRQEDEEIINPPQDEALDPNSNIANLLNRVSTNDGSIDNIIDNASCISIQLPVTVIANGTQVVVTTPADYQIIEDIFDASTTDTDTLDIIFPITVIRSDYTTVEVNSYPELLALVAQCGPENSQDDDIECIDFQYPITASIFNINNELIETIIINSDAEMYDFINNLSSFDIVVIEFPITVILADGTSVEINSLQELETIIINAEDSCDEDDDNDYNDDDCDNCSVSQVTDLLTNCDGFFIDKLERDDDDLEDNYNGYNFIFAIDGSIIVTSDTDNFTGTWTATGEGNGIDIDINIAGLPDVSDTWNLHEIEMGNEQKIDLRLGDDRFRFECGSNGSGGGSGGTALDSFLIDGTWFVSNYDEDGDNQTNDYAGYTLDFDSNGTVIATNGTAIDGTWDAQNNDTKLFLNFNAFPFDEFNDDWDVISSSNTEVVLRDVSGGNGGTDNLTFTKL